MILNGKVHVYGSNVNTDVIIPGKYTKTLDLSNLADHVLEDIDPDFRSRMNKGDIVVADMNFGCGSSREQAPIALKVAGVSVVIARSFARIFFRNSINIGLPVIEVPHHNIEWGDVVSVNLTEGIVINYTKKEEYLGTTMPEVMVRILEEGGLASYLKKHRDYEVS
ncbi:3-isopropylmalate dehydratase [Bacillus sp. LL01]|uniref:3-isopropylmalate dehydratase small subunit n=1 Tax=Bacillus sp. LL01 TaxID=1665556 RepID=UPI00064D59B5|nr:3-isopropylmalate dehydratase small subunit [Bacillus sp. LL01]KMJ55578.1 3-isopropylmalate dehydratase [Bacillus sp. LL01]